MSPDEARVVELEARLSRIEDLLDSLDVPAFDKDPNKDQFDQRILNEDERVEWLCDAYASGKRIAGLALSQQSPFEELESKVIEWAKARRIIPNATATSQLLKAVSEMGELADAVNMRQRDKMKDGVGDVVVCLINLCALEGTSLGECLGMAYEQIKDRKGTLLLNGVFMKEVAE